MSVTVQLNGLVTSVVPVVIEWTKESGPGTVSFTDSSDPDTQAMIDAEGTYVLRLTATTDDGLSSFDEMTIFTAANDPPVANAGPDFATITNAATKLSGSATDDEFPTPHGLTYKWTVSAGDDTKVTFADDTAANTNVTITAVGSYTLQLVAFDGSRHSAPDTVVVTVLADPGTKYADATPANPSATLSGTDVEYRVDLSRLDNTWWGNMISSTGTEIRVTDASKVPIPFDVVYCNKSTKKGLLVYKRAVSASGVIVRIYNGLSTDGGTTPAPSLSVNDPNGQYAAYRSDCLGFWPDGGGSGTDRTSHVAFLQVIGTPTYTTDNSGPIGSNKTTYSNHKYCRRISGPNAYHTPVTFSAAVGTAMSGSQVAQAGGVVRTQGGGTDSEKNSFYLRGGVGADGTHNVIYAGEHGDFASPIPEASAISVSHSSYFHYSGSCANTGASRTVATETNTTTDTNAITSHTTECDAVIIGARPRMSPTNFCDTATAISLVSLYSSQLTATHQKYQGAMLDQATFWGTWTTH